LALVGTVRIAVACYYTEELSLLKTRPCEIEHLADIVDVVKVDATQGWEWDWLSSQQHGLTVASVLGSFRIQTA